MSPLFRNTKKTDNKPKSSDSESNNLRDRLAKTRTALANGLSRLFQSSETLDSGLLEDLEDLLISADLGVGPSAKIIDHVRDVADRRNLNSPGDLVAAMRDEMELILEPCSKSPAIDARPYVMLVVGVNGVGKTTTIAKITNWLLKQDRSVMLAAADTYRAAAVEQLTRWGERLQVPVISQGQGADAAAVAHDALVCAQARSIDVLIIDTAGRQHTQSDLMNQLIKIKRVLNKLDASAPHEIVQILDAGTGQNALSQIQHFNQAVHVNSLCLTKLDGTAKGGILLAIADKFALPVRFIGVGEGSDDLRPFNVAHFVDALLPDPESLDRPN
jgi:fused signal recognition particle receptor